MKVLIAGGGIAGLVLALKLRRLGIESEVFETTQHMRPLGVGINLLPHAVAVIESLGLREAVAARAIETSALHYYNAFGQPIWQEPRGLAAGYPVPQFSVHRGEFQMLLFEEVQRLCGESAVRLGHSFVSLEQSDDEVVATFARPDGSTVQARGDLLVGADGIHSAVRRFYYPDEAPPRFAQRMLWRGVTEAPPYLDGRTMFMAGHQDQKFVCYPISEPLRREGRSRINWIAELRVPGGTPPRSDWNKVVDKSVFAGRFADWRWDWIDVPAVIDGAPAIYEFPLVDRDTLPRWSFGRVTLMGDAAHPMYPVGSNGSAQAILDADYFAECMGLLQQGRFSSPAHALLEYEADRLPKTTGIVLRNRLNGPEQVMQIAHERAPGGFAHIDDVVPRAELEEIAARYKRVAGFDIERLRARAA
ncbi:flavin-dependent oxidoreductase [Aquincola sp. MAHUQ-54]|uniref:Flavin-dependent oxidoreductase n=1 Tax=Aquincola agrisoli TaxID=3119538 RepID=A0AAW9PYL0_9BURK